MAKQCFWCGDEVDDKDFQYIGDRCVWCCDQSTCNRELVDEDRAAYEDAAERLRDDWFGR